MYRLSYYSAYEAQTGEAQQLRKKTQKKLVMIVLLLYFSFLCVICAFLKRLVQLVLNWFKLNNIQQVSDSVWLWILLEKENHVLKIRIVWIASKWMKKPNEYINTIFVPKGCQISVDVDCLVAAQGIFHVVCSHFTIFSIVSSTWV